MNKENGNTNDFSFGSPIMDESKNNVISRGDSEKRTTGQEQEIPWEDLEFTAYMRTAKKQYRSMSYPGDVWPHIRDRLLLHESGRISHRWHRATIVITAAAMVLLILLMVLNRDREKSDTLPHFGAVFPSISVPAGLPERLRLSVYFALPDKPSMPSLTFSVPSLPKPPRERQRILSEKGVNHV